MKIAFDVDGVLADFGGAFNKIINAIYGVDTIPVDYQPKDWNWSDVLTKEMQARGFELIKTLDNFWTTLKPFKEGLDAVKQAVVDNHDVLFLTARASSGGASTTQQTRAWLRNQCGWLPGMTSIIAVGKADLKRQVIEGIGIEAMIDDHGPTVETFDKIPGFQGYLLDRPWNQDAKVKNRVSTVKEFCERVGCLQSKLIQMDLINANQGQSSTLVK